MSSRSISVFRALLAALPALAAATGCSSVPSTVTGAEDVRMTFWDLNTAVAFTLVSADNPKFKDLYSQPRNDASVKVVDAESFDDLLRFAADHGYFDYSEPLSGPAELPEGAASKMMLIQADEKNHAFVLRKGLGKSDRDRIVDFNEIQTRLNLVNNQTYSLQYIGPSGGANYFEQQQQKIDEMNRERSRKGGAP